MKFTVRIHETIIANRVRELEIEIEAASADHARALAQATYPDMLPPYVGIRVLSDRETYSQSHQAGAGRPVAESAPPKETPQ